ncbi:unnamed protein product [Triticum turgidum subsp. durum]|uniref:Uncharacterized protein n=1 Tax=Triticum turgidum subsp. durum TaxID=4567 RepID=A0A9R0PNA1_TRITD|nr:unnamed protein product [Triticum turgidum subsp. durum]
MGSVAAAVQDDSTSPSELEAAFLERCAASGDTAYGELRELLSRLHDPATRQEARIFLTGLRRRSCSDPGGEEGFFRRYGFCVRELLLHDSRCGLPITTLSSDWARVRQRQLQPVTFLRPTGNPSCPAKLELTPKEKDSKKLHWIVHYKEL